MMIVFGVIGIFIVTFFVDTAISLVLTHLRTQDKHLEKQTQLLEHIAKSLGEK